MKPTRMKPSSTVSIVSLTVLLSSAPLLQANEPADSSAALHVLAGASSALLVSAVAYPFVDLGSDQSNAAVVAGLGVGGAVIAGLTKELLDLSGWGQPEWSDLLLTLGGGLLAGTVVYAVSCLQPGREEGSRGIPVVYGAFALILSLPVGENLFRRAIPSLRSRS
jgi:hypothetical protein